jgi:flavin reductase (DIM6/NTAB) family NADH-FMN oxidoreductase RutF
MHDGTDAVPGHVGIDPATLGRDATYKLLTGCVVPRPIAWVSTVSAAGVVNVAPFSAFMIAAVQPPTLVFNCNRRELPDGRVDGLKDTAANIHANREFVINIAMFDQLAQLHASADPVPPEESEAVRSGIDLASSVAVRPPRIARAAASFECVCSNIIAVGDEQTELIFGEVRHAWVREALYADGRIDQEALHPIARLGGPNYATLGEVIRLAGFGSTITTQGGKS